MKKHSHYHKSVKGRDTIDVYDVLDLFEVKSHAVGHAIKKLLMAGQRGAKDYRQDLSEAIDSIEREMGVSQPSNDWVEWEGGFTPVSPDSVVQIKTRSINSEFYEYIGKASEIDWWYVSGADAVVAYRVISQ